MWRAVFVMLVGCDRVLGIDDLTPPPCFRDDFAVDIDPAVWTTFPPDDPTMFVPLEPVANNGAAIFTAPPQLKADGGIFSRPIDFTDGAIEVEVIVDRVPPGGMEALVLVFDKQRPGFGYGFVTADDELNARSIVPGVSPDSDLKQGFDPAFRFWRLRHESSRRTIEFAVSKDPPETDPRTFVVVRNLEDQDPPHAVELRLEAGVFVAGNMNPGEVSYDTVETSGNCE